MNILKSSHTELLRSTLSSCLCHEIAYDTEYNIQLFNLKYSALHNECEQHNDMQFLFHSHIM